MSATTATRKPLTFEQVLGAYDNAHDRIASATGRKPKRREVKALTSALLSAGKKVPAARFEVGQKALVRDTPSHSREVTITGRQYHAHPTYPAWYYSHTGGTPVYSESSYAPIN